MHEKTDEGAENTFGAYLTEVGDHPNLSRQKQDELFARLDALIPDRLDLPDPYSENGNGNGHYVIPPEARQVISEITGYMLKLVIARARKHVGRGVALSDLVQAGNIGLLRAIWRFDSGRGLRLSTYATPWVVQAIGRELGNHSQTIRIPIQTGGLWRKIQKVAAEFEAESGETPTFAQIAAKVGISEAQVAKLYRTVAPTEATASLDRLLAVDEEDSDRYHVVADDGPSPEAEAMNGDLAAKIQAVLGTLTAREAQILRMRFGLDGSREMTLRECADRYGITRERIRQIEGDALARLRHPRRARVLRGLG